MSFDFFVEAVRNGKHARVDRKKKTDILGRYVDNAHEYFSENGAIDDIEFRPGQYVEVSAEGFFCSDTMDTDGIMFSLRGGWPDKLFEFIFALCEEEGYCVLSPSIDGKLEWLAAIPPSLRSSDIPQDMLSGSEMLGGEDIDIVQFKSSIELEKLITEGHSRWSLWANGQN